MQRLHASSVWINKTLNAEVGGLAGAQRRSSKVRAKSLVTVTSQMQGWFFSPPPTAPGDLGDRMPCALIGSASRLCPHGGAGSIFRRHSLAQDRPSPSPSRGVPSGVGNIRWGYGGDVHCRTSSDVGEHDEQHEPPRGLEDATSLWRSMTASLDHRSSHPSTPTSDKMTSTASERPSTIFVLTASQQADRSSILLSYKNSLQQIHCPESCPLGRYNPGLFIQCFPNTQYSTASLTSHATLSSALNVPSITRLRGI